MSLVLTGVSRSFGGVHAVSDVSLELHRGSRHVIFGPNGAGKTTLFRLICGDLPVSGGTVRLFGRDCTAMPVWRRARLGLGRTFQISTLPADLSVTECLVIASLAGHPSRRVAWRRWQSVKTVCRDAAELLESHALGDLADVPTRELSYGDRRLVEIAMALAPKPKLLLLDEPTAGLAPDAAAQVIARIAALPDDVALLLIEHNLEVAFALSETATVLNFGQVVREGTVDDVRADPAVQALYLGAAA